MNNADDSKIHLRHSVVADSADACDDGMGTVKLPRRSQQRRLDIDRPACQTRQSHRRFLIQMASDLASERMRDPVRRADSFERNNLSGRVDDWD